MTPAKARSVRRARAALADSDDLAAGDQAADGAGVVGEQAGRLPDRYLERLHTEGVAVSLGRSAAD
jgi:hypothetical protein